MPVRIISIDPEKSVHFANLASGAEFRGSLDLNNRIGETVHCTKTTPETVGGSYGIQNGYREQINTAIKEFLAAHPQQEHQPMSHTNLLTGSIGVYRTEYAGQTIVVRVFEAPELARPCAAVPMLAVVTYTTKETVAKGLTRQELDELTPEQKRHCVSEAAEAVGYGELHLSAVAMAYWRLIQ